MKPSSLFTPTLNHVTLPGTLWGITSFFNPSKYKIKLENYRVFRDSARAQGLNLIAVELAFDGDPFVLKETRDAEILVQIRGTRRRNLLWQKERLLNLALRCLPDQCDKVVWLDSDIIYVDPTWIQEISFQLERYRVVQAFRSIQMLGQDEAPCKGLVKLRTPVPEVNLGAVARWVESGDNSPLNCGFSWAARRSTIERIGFFDRSILSQADSFMFYSFLGQVDPTMPPNLWSANARGEVRGSTYFANQKIQHLWHGYYPNRLYSLNLDCLRYFKADPATAVKIARNGLLEFGPGHTDLQSAVAEYFDFRDEDNQSPFRRFLADSMAERTLHRRQLVRELTQKSRELGVLRSKIERQNRTIQSYKLWARLIQKRRLKNAKTRLKSS